MYFPRSLYDICLQFVARNPRYDLRRLSRPVFKQLCDMMVSPLARVSTHNHVRLVIDRSELMVEMIHAGLLYPYLIEYHGVNENLHIKKDYQPTHDEDIITYTQYCPTAYKRSTQTMFVLNIRLIASSATMSMYMNDSIQRLVPGLYIYENYFPSDFIANLHTQGIISERIYMV